MAPFFHEQAILSRVTGLPQRLLRYRSPSFHVHGYAEITIDVCTWPDACDEHSKTDGTRNANFTKTQSLKTSSCSLVCRQNDHLDDELHGSS